MGGGEIHQCSRSFSRPFNQFYLYAKPRETEKKNREKKKHKAPPDAKALNLLTGKWLHAAT